MNWKQLLASSTNSVDEELRLRNAYLAAENRILRHQITGRVPLTDAERTTLAELGQQLGKKTLREIATIATAETILAWHRKLVAQQCDGSLQRKAPGRPPIDQELEALVVRMAQENRSWGYDRIVGALANLGYTISDQTVGNILKRHGILPAPERKKTVTWREFIHMHMDLLLATDFFTSEVWTWWRLVISSLLFFMHVDRLKTPRASITPLLIEQWMRLISSQCVDVHAFLARWLRLGKETTCSGFISFDDSVLRPLLCECDLHDYRVPLLQGMGRVVYLPAVHRPQIRDGPMRRQQQLSGLWTDADREAA